MGQTPFCRAMPNLKDRCLNNLKETSASQMGVPTVNYRPKPGVKNEHSTAGSAPAGPSTYSRGTNLQPTRNETGASGKQALTRVLPQ